MTRLTQPGKTDLPFMAITCTPSDTAVEFCETFAEASDAARVNLGAPGASVYVGTVLLQGEHRTRDSASQVAVVVPVDRELRAILRKRYGCATRADIVAAITELVERTMDTLRAAGRIPPDLGETALSPITDPRPASARMSLVPRDPDPHAHPGQSSDDEHTQPGEVMACGCPVGLHPPDRVAPPRAVWALCCALGWPLAWRGGAQ